MAEYLKRDIAKLLGKPIRTVQYWTDEALIIPDIRPSEGKGKARLYSERNLIEFGMIDVMSNEMDVPLDRIRIILSQLREGIFRCGGIAPGVKDVVFDDFYTNSAWGTIKELFFVTDEFDLKNRPVPIWFAVVPKDASGKFDVAQAFTGWVDADVSPRINILKLGAIKNKGIEKIGIITMKG